MDVARPIAAALLELGGIGGIVWGFFLIQPYLGFIFGGIGLILLGLSVDPPARAIEQKRGADQ